MKTFFNILNDIDEATAIGTSGGNPTYPDTGNISGDDDLPTGTAVFGDKYVPEMVPNRLTGATKRWAPTTDAWNYDEFDNSSGMGSWESYHDTLNGLNKLLHDRHWKHTNRKAQRLQRDKERLRRANDIDQTTKLSDDEYDKTIKLTVEDMDILNKIDNYVGKEILDETVVSSTDRRALSQIIVKEKNIKIMLKDIDAEVILSKQKNTAVLTYDANDDITLVLVDIADALGYDFTTAKKNGKTTFTIIK